MKEHQKMVSELRRGDDVVTSGGIIGKVTKVSPQEVIVEIADNVRVKVLPAMITQVLTSSANTSVTTADTSKEK